VADERLTRLEAITLFVEDLAAARRFYGEALGLELIAKDAVSALFSTEGPMINLLQAARAGELVAPRAPGGPGAGPRAMLTLRVADVDAVCARLAAAGVALLNGPLDRPWGRRTAAFQDPAGHVWEVAQVLEGG